MDLRDISELGNRADDMKSRVIGEPSEATP